MVGVRVRDQYPPDRARRGLADCIDVSAAGGSGVEYGHFGIAEKIGIRSRAGHQACIRREQPADAFCKLDGISRCERLVQ